MTVLVVGQIRLSVVLLVHDVLLQFNDWYFPTKQSLKYPFQTSNRILVPDDVACSKLLYVGGRREVRARIKECGTVNQSIKR